MTGIRFLSRFTRKSSASTQEESNTSTQQPATSGRTIPRPLEYWAMCAAMFLLGLMCLWLAVAGLSLARAASRAAEVEFRAPGFEAYVATLPGKPSIPRVEIAPLTAAETASVSVPSMIERSFNSIRDYENGRAEFRLAKQKPVVANVMLGSPAQLAGLQMGDDLTSVLGRPVGSIWELFAMLSASAAPSVELEFKRGEILYKTTLSSHSGIPLDVVTSGLIFDLPEAVRHLGGNDTRRLAEDFIRNYVEAIPPEWRKTYAASLDVVMRGLAKRVADQKARQAKDPAFLRSDRMLVWHHEAFVAEMERFRTESQSSARLQAEELAAAGRAAAAVATALMLVILALWCNSRVVRRHPPRG